jgi:hypothetical protein
VEDDTAAGMDKSEEWPTTRTIRKSPAQGFLAQWKLFMKKQVEAHSGAVGAYHVYCFQCGGAEKQ